jgi:hypothetical protein
VDYFEPTPPDTKLILRSEVTNSNWKRKAFGEDPYQELADVTVRLFQVLPYQMRLHVSASSVEEEHAISCRMVFLHMQMRIDRNPDLCRSLSEVRSDGVYP